MPRSTRAAARPTPRLPDGRAAAARGGRAEGVAQLQRSAGNTAVGRLLGRAPRVGRSDDPAEAKADAHAARGEKGGGREGPARSLDAPDGSANPVSTTGHADAGVAPPRRAPGTPSSSRLGLDAPGAPPPYRHSRPGHLASAPRLGGGRPLPGHLLRRFAPHFRSDLRGVRLHTGREVDGAARSMGAEAFTYGRDVFVRRDKYDPHTRSGRALLRHELAHVEADRGRGRVIRRKTGLPTAAEATTDGGTSGFGFMGKGEWGTYRGRLDKFRAAGDSDTKRQVQLLIKLMDSSKKILASGYNAAKKDFVKTQIPKIKQLYYEATQKADVYDAIATEAQDRDTDNRSDLDRRIRDRMRRLKQAKQAAKFKAMTPEERKAVDRFRIPVDMPGVPNADALIDRVKDAKITMNFHPDSLKFFTDDSDVKQFWSLDNDKKAAGERKGEIYAGSRDSAERIMGYESMYQDDGTVDDSRRAFRPISCGVNIFNDRRGAASGYGKWHFELKDAVKRRATYLSGDSIVDVKLHVGIEGDPRSKHIGTHDHLAGVLANNGHVLDALFMESLQVDDIGSRYENGQSYKGDMTRVRAAIAFKNYIEVQVHGGISIDDVEALVVDVPQDAARRSTAEQKTEGALVDAWKAKYKDKARVRWG